ncbi:MAG TPA: 1,4-alpha-glucan branching protein domain-containing protein [Isosphaeraceae bacterium]|jgi:predicted glycosyl hydrolase (DUF1957 family)|nr:1,4-alpha-glucan branching protein domain-containing protein [Isosphaeraceae bacterium]
MPRGFLSLVVEMHHRLPAPGRGPGGDWAVAASGTYWPILKAIATAADAGASEVLTLAVSPAWLALAADPTAQALARAELDRRADGGSDSTGRWHELRRLVVDRWGGDPIAALRRAHESGAVEVIPTTASPAWLPSVADSPVVARAQVALAAAEVEGVLGIAGKAGGIWLPHLSYRPGLEDVIAESGPRYFGVAAEAFRRGTVRPPRDLFGPLITPPGAAAFGVDPEPTQLLTDRGRRFARDPRYDDPRQAAEAVADHAQHFVTAWRESAERRADRSESAPPISLAAVSAHDLGGDWGAGGDWLERTLLILAAPSPWPATTPGRFLDRYPEGPVGLPGGAAGGLAAARPQDSDVLDRCREAADLLADAVGRRDRHGPLGNRALAQMARELLASQALDWSGPPGSASELDPVEGLARAEGHLARFAELAGLLLAGRLDPARLAALEAGPPYLASLDPARLVPR